jgi:hypothetical protein
VILTYADFLVGAPLRLFGGFAFDRARGKPVVLDIGFGPFKQRVIGPKDVEVDKNDDWSVDFADVGPGELPILIVSGSAKVMGTIIKVGEVENHTSVGSLHTMFETNQHNTLHRSFEKFSTRLICLWANHLSCG